MIKTKMIGVAALALICQMACVVRADESTDKTVGVKSTFEGYTAGEEFLPTGDEAAYWGDIAEATVTAYADEEKDGEHGDKYLALDDGSVTRYVNANGGSAWSKTDGKEIYFEGRICMTVRTDEELPKDAKVIMWLSEEGKVMVTANGVANGVLTDMATDYDTSIELPEGTWCKLKIQTATAAIGETSVPGFEIFINGNPVTGAPCVAAGAEEGATTTVFPSLSTKETMTAIKFSGTGAVDSLAFAEITTVDPNVDTSWYDENVSSFTLTDVADLAGLAKLVNEGKTFADKTVILGNDIDLSGVAWPGIGVYKEDGVGTAFQGTFDGNGKKIFNVTFANTGSNKYRGFFNQIANATVKNLTIATDGFGYTADQLDTMPSSVGGAVIVGHAWSSTIEGCTAEGTFVGTHNVAGIVVRIRNSSVLNCTNKADLVNNYTKLGGIVNLCQDDNGTNDDGSSITGCVNEGAITSTARGENGVGGIIGWAGYYESKITITNCENKGVITATSEAEYGQIAGEIWINNTVTGNKGLAGQFATGKAEANGLNYALVTGDMATYVNDNALEAGKTYYVTSPNNWWDDHDNPQTGAAKPVIKLNPGESITFDTTLAAIDASGITATDGDTVKTVTTGNKTTYLVEAKCAMVNGEKMTLSAAFEYAKANNGTVITLSDDVTLSAWESVDMTGATCDTLTIDGNGKTITGLAQPLIKNMPLNPLTVKNLTFKDVAITGNTSGGMVGAGVITAGTAAAQDITIDGVTVDGGTISSENYAGGFIGYYQGHSTGDLVVRNCVVKNLTLTSSTGGSIGAIAGHVDNGTATVENTVVGNNTMNAAKDGAYREDKTGVVFGTTLGCVVKVDVVNDGKCHVAETEITKVVGRMNAAATLEITDGEYFIDPMTIGTSKDSVTEIVPVTDGESLNITVDGKIIEKADKFFVAKAKIGDTLYATIQEAVDEATDNAVEATVISVIGNVRELGTEVEANSGEFFIRILDKNLTLDLNGKTVNGSFYLNAGSTVKFKNGTILNLAGNKSSGIESVSGNIELTDMTISNTVRHAIRVKGGTAVINGGSYAATGNGTYHVVNVSHASTVTINGGTFTGNKGNSTSGGNAVMIQDSASTVAIKGGAFTNSAGVEGCISAADGLVISGGTFDTWTYDDYLAKDKRYVAVKNAEEMYEVVEATNWIQVADVKWYADGVDAFTLTTAEQLAGVAKLVNEGKTFSGVEITLGDNLALSGLTWPGIGTYKDDTKSFRGTFNGNGKTITGVTFADASNGDVNSEANNYRGFFNYIYQATVKELTIEGSVWASAPASSEYGGALIVGHAQSSTIENCAAIGTVNGTHNTAGVVVRVQDSQIIGCVNKATVTGSHSKMGGIAALVQNSETAVLFERCVNEGSLTSTAKGGDGVGGIVGWIGYPNTENITVKDCENKGAIQATETATVGQIAAESWNGGHVFEGNKGLPSALATGHSAMNGLNYAIVTDGVATYVKDNELAAGNTYLVTAVHEDGTTLTKPVIALKGGESISFDQTLATIDASGITAATELITKTDPENDKLTTYTAAVAKIGDEAYATLQDAINAAPAEKETTVTLLADITLDEGVKVGANADSETVNQKVILDLGGKTVTYEGTGSVIENSANLTITGNGTITAANANEALRNNASGVIVVMNGKFSFDVSDFAQDGYYAERNPITGLYEVAQATNWIQVANTKWYNDTATEFTISTAQELAGLAKLVNECKTFEGVKITLGGDINLSKYVWPGIGVYAKNEAGKAAFQGTFDGADKTVSGMTFADNTGASYAAGDPNNYRGLFNQIANGAVVENLTVSGDGFGTNPPSGEYGGAMIVGHAYRATIRNCVAEGSISGSHNTAGVVVRIDGSQVLECTNNAAVSGSYNKLGGIIAIDQAAQNSGATSVVDGCVNNGTITSSYAAATPEAGGIGGIIGWAQYYDSITVKNCTNNGEITGGVTKGQIFGASMAVTSIQGVNKGLATTMAVNNTPIDGLNFATVADGVATYMKNADLTADNTYLVTAPNPKPVIKLAAGQSITFDQSLAAIDNSGITVASAENEVLSSSTDGKKVTYTAGGKPMAISINLVGSGTVSGMLEEVKYGDTLILEATADDGFVFAGWTDEDNNTDLSAEITLEVKGNGTLTATFVPEVLYTSMTNAVIVTYKNENDLVSVSEIQNMSVQNPTIEVKNGTATVGIQLMDATTLKGENGKPDWEVVPLQGVDAIVDGDTIKVSLPAEGSMRFFRFIPVNGLK